MNCRATHFIPILCVGFQNGDHPYAYAQGRGRILPGHQPTVGDAIWLPWFDKTEVTPMGPQGCFQFERNISFGIILFFVIAEGGDILAVDQPGAIAELDIQQGCRAMTNGADHFAAFPHGLDDVVNEFVFGHVDHRSQSAGYENGVISVEVADLGDGLRHLQLSKPLTIEENLIEFVVLVRHPVQWCFSPFDAVDVDVIALPPEGDVGMGRFGQKVTRGPFFGADLFSAGNDEENLLFHDLCLSMSEILQACRLYEAVRACTTERIRPFTLTSIYTLAIKPKNRP